MSYVSYQTNLPTRSQRRRSRRADQNKRTTRVFARTVSKKDDTLDFRKGSMRAMLTKSYPARGLKAHLKHVPSVGGYEFESRRMTGFRRYVSPIREYTEDDAGNYSLETRYLIGGPYQRGMEYDKKQHKTRREATEYSKRWFGTRPIGGTFR